MEPSDRTLRIRELNEQFLRDLPHGSVMITCGISHQFSNGQLREITQAIQAFEAFGSESNPLEEHDTGAIEFEGVKLRWLIDACGEYWAFQSPDPTDESVTRRYLLLMLNGEDGYRDSA